YGDNALSDTTCSDWFRRFKNNDFELEDKERSGAPKKFEGNELEQLLDEDPSQTLSELGKILQVDESTVSKRLKGLGMIQKQGHWVPYELNPRDVERRFGTCELLLQRQKRKGFLLQLGKKFGLPINKDNKEKTLIKFIKHIENNINGLPKNIINFVRNNSILILNRFYNNFPSPNFTDNPNILITNADKGSVTVILDKDAYVSKMKEILSDTNTYEIVNKDPIKKLTQDLRTLLVRWKRDQFIDEQTYGRLLTTDGVIPRAYGLTKIHKDGNPLRVIVSSINSPLYYLSLFLYNIINDSISKASSHIKDNFHFEKLNDTVFDSQYVLASLDVVSFFTNISVDLAVFGTLTVSPIIFALPSNTINDALNIFNSLHMRLRFTLEVGTGGRLNFLDRMLVTRVNEFLCQFITVDETWIHYFTSETKEQSKQLMAIITLAALLDHFNNILKKKHLHLAKKKVLFHQDNALVYNISCDDCEASYVDQTKRKISMRLHEHISDIKKNICIFSSSSTSSKPRYMPRILMREYALTSTAYKFLDIGIVVGSISRVQITIGDNRSNRMFIPRATWKMFIERHADIERLIQSHHHQDLNVN
ncbi:MOS1T transposase, partial [Pseudoatta argentina]